MPRKHKSSPGDKVELSVIVPTLNEGTHINQLLNSLHSQSTDNFEIIVVDGGSQDQTTKIAESLGARVFVLEGAKEFEARNYAAEHANGPLLVFSCADVVFPQFCLSAVSRHFKENSDLAALTGPGVPYDGGPILLFVYGWYNTLRFLFSRLPPPVKAFSSSTNFLVVRRQTFQQSQGFKNHDVNADGLMGRYLANNHQTLFDNRIFVYISARRAVNWGLTRFTRHYLYVLENFFPGIAKQQWFKTLKYRSGKSHGEIHRRAAL